METEFIQKEKALDWWPAIHPDQVALWRLRAVAFLYEVPSS
jgi:hypothetical protein